MNEIYVYTSSVKILYCWKNTGCTYWKGSGIGWWVWDEVFWDCENTNTYNALLSYIHIDLCSWLVADITFGWGQSAKTGLNVEELFFTVSRDIKVRLANSYSKPEVCAVSVCLIRSECLKSKSLQWYTSFTILQLPINIAKLNPTNGFSEDGQKTGCCGGAWVFMLILSLYIILTLNLTLTHRLYTVRTPCWIGVCRQIWCGALR